MQSTYSYTSAVKKEIPIQENNFENSNDRMKNSRLVFCLVLIITAVVFSGSLKLDWTNWDDDLYVYENPSVSEAAWKDIFTKPADYNTYNPLVIASFALEWKLVKDRPFLYHLNNFLLHLFCTALVWFFLRGMGLSVWWSGFAALLFGIHPLRVESVAWITERKDVLYALFYMAALLAYIRYLTFRKNGLLLLTFLFFALSLLSKVQAVALPFALVLLDWYFQRKIDLKAVTEKAIFFALSLVIGLLGATFFLKNVYGTTDSKAIVNTFGSFEQIVLGGYACAVYILKSIIPYATSTLYPLPASLQAQHWIGAAATVLVFVSALAAWRKYRFVTFGLLFFGFNIFFLLMPFKGNESAFLNDRYTYVAYLGLFFVIAMSMQQLSEKYPSSRQFLAGMAVALLVVLSILTIKYIPVWKNSQTLWTYVIEKYPGKIATAHLNRGHYWYKNNRSGKALEDFSLAIGINPEFPRAYMNRSLIYMARNDTQQALQDCNSYLKLMLPYDIAGNVQNPSVSDALGNRGLLYFKTGQYEKGLMDLDLAIKLNPPNLNNYLTRAFTYMELHEYGKAIQDFDTCHNSDPANPDIINNRGVCYLNSGDLKSALNDFNKAILLNSGNPSYYMNRAAVYYKLGQAAEAKRNVQIAQKLGAVADPAFIK
jgi:protein O-mannosyl-transferase